MAQVSQPIINPMLEYFILLHLDNDVDNEIKKYNLDWLESP